MRKTPSARRISPRNFTASSEPGTGGQKFSICSKSPQKAATNWLYTKGAVGEERKPPHKMELLPFEKGPQTLAAARPEQAAGGLRHPTVPPPMPGNRRAADRLLTLSALVEFSYRTAPALLLFHGAVRFLCPARAQELPGPGFFCIHCRNCPPAVDRCAPLWYHNGRKNRIRQGKSLGKRRLSPAEGAKLSGGPIRAGTKDGCGSGEAHCEDRRCKAATPNLSGKRTE